MRPFLVAYVFFCFFCVWSTFFNDSKSLITNSISNTIYKAISSETIWSSITCVKLLSLLSMVNLGVFLIRIMYGEYLALLWIPQRYANKILGTWTPYFYMLKEETTMSPCFRVLIILSTIPLQDGHFRAVNWCVIPKCLHIMSNFAIHSLPL